MLGQQLLFITSLVRACDFVIQSQVEDTNIWATLAAVDTTKSPFVACLTASAPDHRFTLDDSVQGCTWSSSSLTIQ